MQLNPNRILDTAMEILHDYGLPDLTMRRLARALGVAPGALYWHFPSKQHLLGAIAQRILGDVPAPRSEANSAEMNNSSQVAVNFCTAIYSAVTSVRDGAEIALAAIASGTSERDIERELVDIVGPAGRVAYRYILGAALELQARQAVASAMGEANLPQPDPVAVRDGASHIVCPRNADQIHPAESG